MQCKSPKLDSHQIGNIEPDGYIQMHHTCQVCGAHFDHLEGVIYDSCTLCTYKKMHDLVIVTHTTSETRAAAGLPLRILVCHL